MVPSCGATLAPGRARTKPSMTTRSVGSSPDWITRNPPRRSPGGSRSSVSPSHRGRQSSPAAVTGRARRRRPAADRTDVGGAIATRSRANWPGARNRSGLGTVGARMDGGRWSDRAHCPMKSSVPSRAEAVLVAEADHDLVGQRTTDAGALTRERQEVGFAHVEVEIKRIK